MKKFVLENSTSQDVSSLSDDALYFTSYIAGSDGFELEFSAAQWAVTPGQSAVVYRGEVCLGGGVIS